MSLLSYLNPLTTNDTGAGSIWNLCIITLPYCRFYSTAIRQLLLKDSVGSVLDENTTNKFYLIDLRTRRLTKSGKIWGTSFRC